ncbi:DUF456 domain-containing protein [Candidatus Woesearchaeota archaeon]|nr:DUF456 domain-containing protein [Candidatus Woesearchaeota archaeon]
MVIEIIALIAFIFLALSGIIISMLGISGTWLVLLGGILYNLITWSWTITIHWLVLLLVLATSAEILEFSIIGIAAKKYKASKTAVIAAIIGGILGAVIGIPIVLFGSLLGLLLGAFLGAFIAEILIKKDFNKAITAATGAVIGGLGGKFVKFLITIAMVIIVFVIIF